MIRSYVRSCETCQRTKPKRHQHFDELLPLLVPEKPWQSLTIDFVIDLSHSETERFDFICVMIDRFTKMIHYVSCHKIIIAQKLVVVFVRDIVKLHEISETIISDRESVFVSVF